MKHIYDKHKLIEQMTIDDLLVSENMTHKRYRNWLYKEGVELYPLTKGLYEEAILSDNPRRTFKLTRSEANKVMYSKGWTETRSSKADEIIEMLKNEPNISQEYIAQVLGVTQARVSQVATKYNLRPKRKKRTEVSTEDIIALKKQDLPVPIIADKLNISVSTVYKKIQECKST